MVNRLEILQLCEGTWGKSELFYHDPDLSQRSDVIYLPFKLKHPWGIFDTRGVAIDESVDKHGPDANTASQVLQFRKGAVSLDETVSDDGYYFYGGVISLHYGHFIINTLSRLWPYARIKRADPRILFHGPGNPDVWFQRPFIREIFSSLGIKRENVVSFDRPTRIRQLLIPHTSFQEQHFAHRVFSDLCKRIGNRLVGWGAVSNNEKPTYLSKTAVVSGVGRVVNELVIENALRQKGVDIIHPEQLPLVDQIKIFTERTTILAITGSALHTGIFSPPQARIICLSPTDKPNSNFSLLDRVNRTRAEYYYAPGTRVVEQGRDRFLTNLELRSPELIAADLLSLI